MNTGAYSATSPNALQSISAELSEAVSQIRFQPPVSVVYNPLEYARKPFHAYLERYGSGPKRVVFLGMNPGPWGMGQTGVPFGEVSRVTAWLGIGGRVDQPAVLHPRRPVSGFDCSRSEVSGRRLWDLFSRLFKRPECFFQDHFVANYCPLLFFDQDGRNLTPDKLSLADRRLLFPVCDAHLDAMAKVLRPQWIVGVGRFAEKRASAALSTRTIGVVGILHPSPASPASNRNWEENVIRCLHIHGVWPEHDSISPCGKG